MAAARPCLAAALAFAAFAAVAGCNRSVEKCRSDPSVEICLDACEEGDGRSCERLGTLYDQMIHLDPDKAMLAFERACELGSPRGCTKRRSFCGGTRNDDEPMPKSEAECRERFTSRACELGDELSCRERDLVRSRGAR